MPKSNEERKTDLEPEAVKTFFKMVEKFEEATGAQVSSFTLEAGRISANVEHKPLT